MDSEWIDYKVAAKLMLCPPAYLRRRDAAGTFLYWPEIERWQPRGPRTQLFIRRAHVDQWIEASRAPVQEHVKTEFNGIGYQSIAPDLRRLGASRLMRSIGVK